MLKRLIIYILFYNLCALVQQLSFIFAAILQSKELFVHFSDGESKAWNYQVMCPRQLSWVVSQYSPLMAKLHGPQGIVFSSLLGKQKDRQADNNFWAHR